MRRGNRGERFREIELASRRRIRVRSAIILSLYISVSRRFAEVCDLTKRLFLFAPQTVHRDGSNSDRLHGFLLRDQWGLVAIDAGML